jgi:hypothetical protein
MTFQVALRGTDGVVIASDICVESLNRRRPLKFTDVASKIIQTPGSSIIAAPTMAAVFSGDNCAQAVAVALAADWPESPCNEQVEKIAGAALDQHQKNEGHNFDPSQYRKVLVVSKNGPDFSFWSVAYKTHDKRFESSWCPPSLENKDALFGGDEHNTARYIVEHFYKHYPLPEAAKLKFLAAHTILTGHIFNSCGVDGLEMVVWTKNGFERLQKDELKHLGDWSKKTRDDMATAVTIGSNVPYME